MKLHSYVSYFLSTSTIKSCSINHVANFSHYGNAWLVKNHTYIHCILLLLLIFHTKMNLSTALSWFVFGWKKIRTLEFLGTSCTFFFVTYYIEGNLALFNLMFHNWLIYGNVTLISSQNVPSDKNSPRNLGDSIRKSFFCKRKIATN